MGKINERYVKKIVSDLMEKNYEIDDSKSEIDLISGRIFKAIIELQKIGLIENNYKYRIVECLYGSMLYRKLDVYVINSHALVENSTVLKDKPQYKMNPYLTFPQ